MSESGENRNQEVGAISGEPSVTELHSRLTSIEEQLGKQAGAEKLWWQRLEFIGPVSATLITAIVSLATVTVQETNKSRELELARIQQQAVINQDYLNQAIEIHDDALKREFALNFYSQVVQDESVRGWAIGQLEIMRTQRQADEAKRREEQLKKSFQEAKSEEKIEIQQRLETASQEAANLEARARDTQRSVTIDNLIAPDRQTRWQAAEDLSTIWGKDPDLPIGLLRFIREHTDNSLAIFNVVVVLEDLVKCCADNLRTAANRDTVKEILELADNKGGEKARQKVKKIRGDLID